MGRETFVLVHGAWHGGWCWSRVSKILRAEGHEVFTPTLTGLGERSHLLSRDINLDTHIRDVVNVFEYEDIRDAVLVGHSYAGWVISGAIEHLLPRVKSVVYLDAALPPDGVSGVETQSPHDQAVTRAAWERGDVAFRPRDPAHFEISDPADVAWLKSKLTPQPIGVALQPIRLTGARERVARKTYVRAMRHPSANFDKALAACKADASWRVFEKDWGHDMMVDRLEELAEFLIDAA
jgi:pimeloyl-ACP methyl ester carboxylesterase